jgi:hypothetical protein
MPDFQYRGVEGSKELMQENALLVFTHKKKMDRMGGKIASILRERVPHLTSSWGRQVTSSTSGTCPEGLFFARIRALKGNSSC